MRKKRNAAHKFGDVSGGDPRKSQILRIHSVSSPASPSDGNFPEFDIHYINKSAAGQVTYISQSMEDILKLQQVVHKSRMQLIKKALKVDVCPDRIASIHSVRRCNLY